MLRGESRESLVEFHNTNSNERVTVALSVNGVRSRVSGEPRTTLADTLRTELRLTGTHIGCEHGVCGMCTVLVDRVAVRSCLLLTCQLDGSSIVTIEGVGRSDELHPIQIALAEHFAVQCGFCTPAFVLSALDLLMDHADLQGLDLAAEMSGVLCRCTGYQSILAAIADVAGRFPRGIPGPLGIGPTDGSRNAER